MFRILRTIHVVLKLTKAYPWKEIVFTKYFRFNTQLGPVPC